MKNSIWLSLFLTILFPVLAKDSYKLFVTSIPKTGTTMLSKLVTMLTNRKPRGSANTLLEGDLDLQPDRFLLSHASALSLNRTLIENDNFKTIVLLRDPRDVIVSMYYYFGKQDAQTLGLDFEKDKDTIIMLRITKWYLATSKDSSPGEFLKDDYEQFLAWGQLSNVYFTRYERLVGSKGGGSDEVQKQEIHAIASFLGIALKPDQLELTAKRLYGGTVTFRNGAIGSWRKHFTQEHIEAFKKYTGTLLITLGYENDINWGL